MQMTQLDSLQQAARPRRLRFVETPEGELAVRGVGRGRRNAPKVTGRRVRDWLLLERPVAGRESRAEALRSQSSLVFAKYVLPSPGAGLALRADLPLVQEVVEHPPRLRALLAAVLSPDTRSRASEAAVEQASATLRAALAEAGKLKEVEGGFALVATVRGGRSRTLAIELSGKHVRFSMPLGAQKVEPDPFALEVVGTYLFGLNEVHFLGRAGITDGKTVAEVMLPLAELTAAECRLAVGALTSFAAYGRAVEALMVDARARRLYAAQHGLDSPGSAKPSGS